MKERAGSAFWDIVCKDFCSHKNTLFLPHSTNSFGLKSSLQNAQEN